MLRWRFLMSVTLPCVSPRHAGLGPRAQRVPRNLLVHPAVLARYHQRYICVRLWVSIWTDATRCASTEFTASAEHLNIDPAAWSSCSLAEQNVGGLRGWRFYDTCVGTGDHAFGLYVRKAAGLAVSSATVDSGAV
jgi:hypothetical protein